LKPLKSLAKCGRRSDEIIGNSIAYVALALVAADTEFPAKENILNACVFERNLKWLPRKARELATVRLGADVGDSFNLVPAQQREKRFKGMCRMSENFCGACSSSILLRKKFPLPPQNKHKMLPNRKPMYMRDWISKLDDFLRLSERDILSHAGKVSHRKRMPNTRNSTPWKPICQASWKRILRRQLKSEELEGSQKAEKRIKSQPKSSVL